MLSDEDIRRVVSAISEEFKGMNSCRLSPEDQQAVVDLLKTKRNAVRASLWLFGALLLWILKDAYFFVINHLTLGWEK